MNHELEGKILQENFYVGHQQIAIMTLTPSISRENMMHFTQRIIGPFRKDAFFKTLIRKAGFDPGKIENQFEEDPLQNPL